MISCFGGASEAVRARIRSAWKTFRELSGPLLKKQGLSVKKWGKIYQCCVRPVLLHCCDMLELTVADGTRLRGLENRMIRIMCEVRLVVRLSTDVLRGKVDVAVKIEDMIIQNRLWWYSHVMRGTLPLKQVRLWKVN